MSETLPEPYSGEPLATDRVVVKDPSCAIGGVSGEDDGGERGARHREIRVTALGTGYPARRAQGCAGFMMELGNGEVFIFDAGAGTNLAFNTLRVPYGKANKFFITHYHLDHIADLPVYYDFGQSNGRLEPMHIHGPDGGDDENMDRALVDASAGSPKWHDHTQDREPGPARVRHASRIEFVAGPGAGGVRQQRGADHVVPGAARHLRCGRLPAGLRRHVGGVCR